MSKIYTYKRQLKYAASQIMRFRNIIDVEQEDNIKPICIDMIHTNLLAQ